uniref:Tetraspanin n=1 Tax=Salarias fasciatus TaxID=181472 RepID=A0A672JFE9_SALFA
MTYQVVGVVVGVSGFFLYNNYRHTSLLFSESYIILPAAIVLASAVLSLIAGLLGTWISIQSTYCQQGLFVYLLVVIFCLQSTGLALAYFHSVKLDSDLAPVSDVFQKYNGSSKDPASETVDVAQHEFECCGVHNYTDWLETPWFNQSGGLWFPRSCCNSTFPSCSGSVDQPWLLYSQGCQEKLQMKFQFFLKFIFYGSLVVFLVEVVLLLLVGQIMKQPSPQFGYRVLEND